ncbi:Ig-like domain-containing protein, partial [Pseudomonas sp. Gutcm_11s]|uniref:Ig-like domain-containing protein n=1 Tax=Pseudomonas sp. Gutcm_11s TaxID=3026088 RepID=UPI00235E4602
LDGNGNVTLTQAGLNLVNSGQDLPAFTLTPSDGTVSGAPVSADPAVTAVNNAPVAVNDPGSTLTGLTGQYYAYHEGTDGGNLSSLSQVRTFIGANQADATFTANNINYSLSGGDLGGNHNLQTFLGSDANSLNGVDPENSSDAIIRLNGTVQLQAGSYQFQVRADDGYSIAIDGVVVASFDGNQSPNSNGGAFTISESGYHTIEIIYWDQGGQAVLQPTLSFNGGAYQTLDKFSPQPANSALVTAEDTSLNISAGTLLGNDSDADGDSLKIISVGNPSHGTVSLSSDGSTVTFTPTANYYGPATFTYTISDGHGGTSTATVTVNVNAVNDAPVASDDSGSVNENASLTVTTANGVIAGLGRDTDVDGDTLTVTAIRTGAENGTGTAGTVGSSLTGTYGTLTLNANGSYTYAANNADRLALGTTGSDVFTYTVSDGKGGIDTATLTITVTGLNDAPVAVNDSGAVNENAILTVPVADGVIAGVGRDTDVDGDSLTVSAIRTGTESGSGTAGTVGSALTGTYGTLTLNANGSYTYVANNADRLAQGVTATDTFTYTVSDGKGGNDTATLTITVTGQNDAPVAVDDSGAVNENASLTVPVANGVIAGVGRDTDVDGDSLIVSAIRTGSEGGTGTAGTVGSALTGTYGTLTLNANGSYTYVANNADRLAQGVTATDTFTYTVSDNKGGLDTATLTITVTGQNDAPVAVNDSGAVNENATLTVPVADGVISGLGRDTDVDGDTLSISAIRTGTEGGTGTAGTVGSALTGTYGTLTLNANGSYTYVANNADRLAQGTTGTDTFTYTVSDGKGGNDTATLTITVTGQNDAPVAVDDSGAVNEDATLTVTAANGVIQGTGRDSDIDGDALTISAIRTGAETGTGTAGSVGSSLNGTYGTLTLNTDGSYTYVANNANSVPTGTTVTDSFTYTVSDSKGGIDTATLSIRVTGQNDAPTISASSARVSEEGLAGGRADTTGTSDTTNSTTFSGQMSVQDSDSSSLTVTLSAPTTAVTSGGQSITWSGAGTGLLIGYVGTASAANEAIRVSIDNNGNYTVTLSKPLDHGSAGVEDVLSLGIGVTVSDGAKTATSTLTVGVEDDMPSGAIVRTLEVPVDTIIIKNLQGGWTGATFDSGSGSPTPINRDTDSNVDAIYWGGTSGSGYELVDNAALATSTGQVITAGSLFKLADFSHVNRPVSSSIASLDTITMTMTMDVVINGTVVNVPFTVLLDHTETPNGNDASAPSARDIITLPSQNVTVVLNGQSYSFELEGFKDSSGNIVNTIYTNENATNTFEIYGSLNTTLAMPSISGSIASTAGADGFASVTWGSLNNEYGTLTTSADGGYRFVLNEKGYALVQSGSAVPAPTFSYTVRDKDGDTFNSTLTINLQADKDSTPVANDNFAQAVLTQRTIDRTDVAGFSVSDVRNSSSDTTPNQGSTVVTSGTMTVSGGTGSITFSANLTGNGSDTFRYALETQNSNGTWTTGSYVTLDSNNTISNLAAGTYRLRLYVLDQSRNNGNAVATLTNIALITTLVNPVIEAAAAAGNVLTDTNNHVGSTNAWGSVDSLGQEGAVISAVNGFNVAGSGNTTINGQYGTLSIAANGSYTYTPHSTYSNVGKSETFTYTLSQPDGDSDTANLIINIGNTAYTAPTPITGSGTLNGTSGDDVILGSSGADTLNGGAGNDHLEGKAGNDTLYGNAGKDILIGGEGDDILYGGAGGDTFVWQAGHTGKDVIKDFTLSGTDRDTIDLRDLLQGENDGNIGDYLRVVTNGTSTTLEVSTHGEFAHGAAADVTITLENTTLPAADFGTTSSQMINSLIAGGDNAIVKVDH